LLYLNNKWLVTPTIVFTYHLHYLGFMSHLQCKDPNPGLSGIKIFCNSLVDVNIYISINQRVEQGFDTQTVWIPDIKKSINCEFWIVECPIFRSLLHHTILDHLLSFHFCKDIFTCYPPASEASRGIYQKWA
jgi:hypothetical protein